MVFDPSRCIIRKLYCGNGDIPKDTPTNKYSKKGDSYTCLKKGIGMGKWTEIKKTLFDDSLLHIDYVTTSIESNFKKENINTITDLLETVNTMGPFNIKTLLKNVCGSNQKAINSILLYMHNSGIENLPSCRIVEEKN